MRAIKRGGATYSSGVTDDQYNNSESDRKSFYSQVGRGRIQFNFQEKNEDYLDDEPELQQQPKHPQPKESTGQIYHVHKQHRQPHSPGYIVGVNLPKAPKDPSSVYRQHMSDQINYKPDAVLPTPIINPKKLYDEGKAVEVRQYDYERLYKKIRLAPMAEERNESQTIEEAEGNTQGMFKHYRPKASSTGDTMYKEPLFSHKPGNSKLYQQSSTYFQNIKVGSLKNSQIVDEQRSVASSYFKQKKGPRQFRPFIQVSELTQLDSKLQAEVEPQAPKINFSKTATNSSQSDPLAANLRQGLFRKSVHNNNNNPESSNTLEIIRKHTEHISKLQMTGGETEQPEASSPIEQSNLKQKARVQFNTVQGRDGLKSLLVQSHQPKQSTAVEEDSIQTPILPFFEQPEKPRIQVFVPSPDAHQFYGHQDHHQVRESSPIVTNGGGSPSHDQTFTLQDQKTDLHPITHNNSNQNSRQILNETPQTIQQKQPQHKDSYNVTNNHNMAAAEVPAPSEQFDLKVYFEVYFSLKNVLAQLKSSQLLKALKAYLELIATGKVDNYQYLRIPLHKKKILKMALLYQRVAVVIVAFSYASNTLVESQKYLSNLIKYALSNYLCVLRVISNQSRHAASLANCPRDIRELLQLSAKEFQTKGFQTVRDNNEILVQTIFRLSKYDNLFFENLKKFIKNSSKFSVEQTFFFILEYFAFFLNLCELEHRVPFLAVAPNPYLPPAQNQKYTLVIDFLQVMCHPKKGDLFRPYSQYFLDEMSEYYEIVTFCTAFPNQANKVIDLLDRKKRIQHKLYRHHAIKSNGVYLKDLSRLGRDLSKVIMIDCQQEHVKLNQQHSICIKTWSGSSKDTALAELCPMLAMVVIKNMDTGEALSKYKSQMTKNQKTGVKYLNFGMNLD